jgi:O-antigen ligase
VEAGSGGNDVGGVVASRVPLDLVGEGLLLAALVVAPWLYGSVEDTVRYSLCAVLLVSSGLCLWPDLCQGRLPRGVGIAMLFPAFALVQIALGQTLAPVLTVEAAIVGFSLALVWALVDGRAASAATNSSSRLALAFLVVCVAESAFAAVQWSADRAALFGQRGGLQTMPFGSYVNHNNFAGLVSMGAPLAVAMAVGDLRRSGKLSPWGLGLLGVACGLTITVFASGSRGGAVALVFGLLTLAWITSDIRRKATDPGGHRSWLGPFTIGVVILVAAALAVPSPTRARLARLFETSGSIAYRVDIAAASLRAFAGRPLLGSGLGGFGDAAAPFKTGHGDVRSNRAEADLLEFPVEGGLALIVILVLFGRFAWRSARHELINGRSRSGKWLRAGALASSSTMLVHSLFDFGFRIPANALAFAVVLGIGTASSSGPKPAGATARRAFISFLAALALACVYRSVGAASERGALARTSPESRLAALDGVVESHPYLDGARRQRGLAWLALAYSHGQYDVVRLQRAHDDLQGVLKLRPGWGEARTDLGWVKYYQGRTEEAKQEMGEAARLDPTHIGIGLAYAQVLAWSGETARAVEELARLRRTNPSWPRSSARELAASWTRDDSILANIP